MFPRAPWASDWVSRQTNASESPDSARFQLTSHRRRRNNIESARRQVDRCDKIVDAPESRAAESSSQFGEYPKLDVLIT